MKPSLILALSTLLLSLAAEADSPLETALAEYREIPLERHLDGVVEAVHQGTLSAQTNGQVMEILFDVDDYVDEGSLVIRLKDTEQQTRLVMARSKLATITARLEESIKEQERVAAVFKKGLISDAALDQANTALESAIASHKGAVAGLGQAQEQLGYTWVKAPFSGIVTERHIEVGESASPGQRLMSGLSLNLLRVSVDVPQSLIPKIRDNGKARIHLPDSRVIEATKLTIFPYAHSASNTFKVRLGLPEGALGLNPGMFIKTSFPVGTQKRLLIPQKTVVYRGEVIGTYVIDHEGNINFRYIRPGHKTEDGMIVILAGLQQNELVALDPIAAGARLKQQIKGSNGG